MNKRTPRENLIERTNLQNRVSNDPILQFFGSLLIASSASFICYSIFYSIAPVIWSMNVKVVMEECAPWMRQALESRDGIEVYILYIMTFLTITTAWLLKKLCDADKRQILQFLILPTLSSFYYRSIGLNLPMSFDSSINLNTLGLSAVIILLLFIMMAIEKYHPHLLGLAVSMLLLPLCFVSIKPISMGDLSYIFDPALKLLQGIAPSRIYFQYDLLLSLFAAFWIKLKINPYYFQILGQLSLYLLLISIFFFSRVFFRRKSLSIYLLIALVIFKIYAIMHDPTIIFQVTPLRLDLWIILLLLVYSQGPYHWSVALAVGSFVIFCRSFGIIYFLSYCQLIVLLAAFDLYDGFKRREKVLSLTRWAERQWQSNIKNFLILIGAFVSGHYLFKNHGQTGAGIYLKLGLGFLPVKTASFYWYVPVVFASLYLFLLRQRKILKERYFYTGMFLLLLAVGQSIYFLGRSHENNLINISAILLLCLFTLIDLADYSFRDYKNGRYKYIAKLLPTVFSVFFVLSTAYCYQQNIVSRAKVQYQNLVKLKFIDSKYFYTPDMDLIKNVTHNSKHVYFMTPGDFLYYYLGDYSPVGFYSPYCAWIFKKDVVEFLQDLLDKDYYLVAQLDDWDTPEMLESLKFENRQATGNYVIVWNSSQNQ